MVNLGLVFIMIAAVLFIAEVIIPGFFIGVVATAFLLLGFLGFIVGDVVYSPLWIAVIFILGVSLGMTVSILIYKKIGRISKPTTTTGETLIGRTGTITRRTDPERPTKGKVRLGSEIWSAESELPINEGTKVRVLKSVGAHVKVGPVGSTAGRKKGRKKTGGK